MLERRGYDCCWTAEINHDPFLPLVLAAEHTTTIELGTSIAVAFARNPMTVANVTTKRYFEEVTTPALLRGMERSGRKRSEFQLSCPLFVVTGNDDAELAANAIGTRKQIAFYASTPAYRKVLELHGWGDLQTELHRLSLQGGWDEMGSLIDDEVLHAFAVVAPLHELSAAIRERCDGVIDRVLVGFPSSVEEATVTAVLKELRSSPVSEESP